MHDSWHFDGYERVRPISGPQDGSGDICHVYHAHHDKGRLIAAAPDLLAACEAGAAAWGPRDVFLLPDEKAALKLIRDAISKAKGGAS